jgi:hypothetical protein
MSQLHQDPNLGALSPAPPQDDAGTGLTIGWARSVQDVIEAWQLVYTACRRSGLIPPNHQRLFTVPKAIGPQTLVLQGRLGIQTVTTLTAIADGPSSLPLDDESHTPLGDLRRQRRPLLEICLVGDRRDRLSRTLQAKRALLRLAFGYARARDISDVVLRAADDDAHLYNYEYGFAVLPAPQGRPTPANSGRVVLHLNVEAAADGGTCPPGLAWCRQHPVTPRVFSTRFEFDPARLRGSLVADFLHGHAQGACTPDAPPYGTSDTAA